MPSFQTEIYDVYDHELIEIVALNHDANAAALEWYIGNILSTQDIELLYPFVYDETGEAFQAYEAENLILPSIFLIDQTGLIRLRFDGATDAETFFPELDEIILTIEELLDDPPGGL